MRLAAFGYAALFLSGLVVVGAVVYERVSAEPKIALVIPANDPARKCP